MVGAVELKPAHGSDAAADVAHGSVSAMMKGTNQIQAARRALIRLASSGFRFRRAIFRS